VTRHAGDNEANQFGLKVASACMHVDHDHLNEDQLLMALNGVSVTCHAYSLCKLGSKNREQG
jgi:hypothetical protein